MKKEYKLKGISYCDEEINEEVLYNIFADIIIDEIKRGEKNEQINSRIA